MASKKPRVLIMDNDEATARPCMRYCTTAARSSGPADAQHAMEELAKQDVSVVVSDLMLGDTNVGYILKTIKQLNPQTQCIVVTSFNDTSRLIELINQAQITRYLPKPLSKGMLERNLEYMLERFHALCSLPALQKRQSVAPISDPQEKQLSGNFRWSAGQAASQDRRLRKGGGCTNRTWHELPFPICFLLLCSVHVPAARAARQSTPASQMPCRRL